MKMMKKHAKVHVKRPLGVRKMVQTALLYEIQWRKGSTCCRLLSMLCQNMWHEMECPSCYDIIKLPDLLSYGEWKKMEEIL